MTREENRARFDRFKFMKGSFAVRGKLSSWIGVGPREGSERS